MTILSFALYAVFGAASFLAVGVLATSLRRALRQWRELSSALSRETYRYSVRVRMIGCDNVTPLRPRATRIPVTPGRYRWQQSVPGLREAA